MKHLSDPYLNVSLGVVCLALAAALQCRHAPAKQVASPSADVLLSHSLPNENEALFTGPGRSGVITETACFNTHALLGRLIADAPSVVATRQLGANFITKPPSIRYGTSS